MRLFLLPAVASALANTVYPLPEYKFSWTADVTKSKLSVEIVLTPPAAKPSVGWVGFGIAGGGGGMLGGDVFTAYSTGASACKIQDRVLVTAKALPAEDTTSGGFSDWTLDSCSKVGNVLTVAASRALLTYDEHDLDFVSGPMTLLFAWSQTQPTSPYDLATHENNGGYTPKTMSLWGAQTPSLNLSALESDYDVVNNIMPDVPIAPGSSYTCVGFNITTKNNTATHAIVLDPIVVPGNVDFVHHMVIWLCSAPFNTTPFSCFSMPSNCRNMLFAWGKGGGPMVLPPITGISIGNSGRQYAVLQLHYNNPGNLQGLTDASGLAIYRTNQLRQQETGTFLFGTIGLPIPPKMSSYTLSGSCNESLSQNMLPSEGVTVYASFLHAHERGRRLWTSHLRNGQLIGTIGNNQNYDFNLQKVQSLPPTIVKRGDAFITYCNYDTSADENTTIWGENTENEMCFNFLYYYPILNASVSTTQCGTRNNPYGAGHPTATACSLIPGHPPVAYNVTNLAGVDINFLTGGNASCAAGFNGSAQFGCSGYGAPFTFAGCSRIRVAPTPEKSDLSSAPLYAVSLMGVLAVFAL
jgi:hypothetical protein